MGGTLRTAAVLAFLLVPSAAVPPLGPAPLLAADAHPTYRGRRISLEVTNADVRDVLRMLAQAGAVNIIMGDDVKGRVTLSLHDVPWDQALDVVLMTVGMARVTIDP